VFFLLGLESAAWASRIPAIKDSLHLSGGRLGLALLGAAVGSIVAMPATGALLTTVVPRRVVQAAFVPFAVMLPLAAVAGSTIQLFLVLLGWGIGIGGIDVAMNTEAARVQDAAGRSMMTGIHASYSIGGLIGAGTGAVAAAVGLAAGWHFVLVSAVVLIAGLVAAEGFPNVGAAERTERRGRRWLPAPSWALAALAVVAFGCFLAEGAANDWSAVYLHSSLGTSSGVAAAGYAVFACAMAGGRLFGDRLSDRFGPARLVQMSAATAAVGLGAALLIAHPAAALVGFALLGIGLSPIVPLVFSATARLGSTGPALASVTTCGYLGLLAGPPIIGGLSNLVGLPAALSVVVGIAAVTVVLARFLKSSDAPVGEVRAA
jgi:MFS family permease